MDKVLFEKLQTLDFYFIKNISGVKGASRIIYARDTVDKDVEEYYGEVMEKRKQICYCDNSGYDHRACISFDNILLKGLNLEDKRKPDKIKT